MSFSDSTSQVRKLKLFIPSSQAPLLTTYGKMMLSKLSPLKEKYQIFSKRRQFVRFNPQTQYLSASDVDKLNRSYEAFKKSKGNDIKAQMKQSQYRLDPLYRSIYRLKENALKNRAVSQDLRISNRRQNELNLSKSKN